MSEEAEVKPKKRSKLPVVLVLVLLIGGGGFFGMKMKGPAPKPQVKAGATEPLGEFLVNLSSGTNVYLRTEISLQFRDKFKAEAFEASKDAIKDAVGQILSSKTLQQVSAPQRPALKKEIAAAINGVLLGAASADEKKEQEELAKAALAKPDKKADPAAEDRADWDSQTGPVLHVYFTSFTTQ